MQLPTSELRPGLAYACDWLQDALSEYPKIASILDELRSHAPYPFPHCERLKFEKVLLKKPEYCRDHQSGTHLFEMVQGAYVNPAVEAMWMGWQLKTEGVEDSYATSGNLEPLEPILGWSFVDGNGQNQWALDHPVASGRQPQAIDVKESALSEYVGIGGTSQLFAALRKTLDETANSVLIHGVLLYNGISARERNTGNPDYMKYRAVVELLYKICERTLPENWEVQNVDMNIHEAQNYLDAKK